MHEQRNDPRPDDDDTDAGYRDTLEEEAYEEGGDRDAQPAGTPDDED